MSTSPLTAATINDAQCRFVATLMPCARDLLAEALAPTEPQRSLSRGELAKQWITLACTTCTLHYLEAANHPTGCIFVGWGHGWQPCQTCGGSGLSALGNDLDAQRTAASTP